MSIEPLLDAVSRAEADETDVRGAQFVGEDAAGASCCGVTFERCTFTGCRMAGAVFSGSMFFDCTLTGCDLSGARFSGCSFKRCTLEGCKLSGADFCEAYGSDSRFEGCIGDYSNHASAVYKKCVFSGGSFREAAFFRTELRECRLETDFTLAEFQRTALSGADLRKCELYGAVFTADALPGVRVTRAQAADLAALLGLIVE